LLVEGLEGRLAVECDGDVWHGLDRYEADMTRQRILERCGLPFLRVRGSTFYRGPESALESLWTMLHRLGLAPTARRSP
jgi:very-short-patch-repair endonuclease